MARTCARLGRTPGMWANTFIDAIDFVVEGMAAVGDDEVLVPRWLVTGMRSSVFSKRLTAGRRVER